MRIVRNIITLLVTQLSTWAISLVTSIIVPAYLGPNQLGLWGFAYSFAGLFGLGMSLGTGTYLTWRIAREPEMAGRLTSNTLMLQVPLVLASGGAGLLLVRFIDPRPLTFALVAIVVLSIMINAFTSTCAAALAGFQIMRVPAFINVGALAIAAVGVVLGIYLRVPIQVLILCTLLSATISFVLTLVYTIRKIHLLPSIDLTLWRPILVGGLPFFTLQAVVVWYAQVDVSLLKVLVQNDTVVGWYTAADRIAAIPLFLPSIVASALLPALSQERTADSPRFQMLTSRCVRLVALISIPASAGMILLSSNIFGLLHLPSSFNPAIPIVVILSLQLPFVGVDIVLGTALIAVGRQRSWTLVGVTAAIVNPLVNLWAIPFTQAAFGNGAIGAACVTLLNEVIMFTGAMFLRPKGIFTRWDIWYILRCAVAVAFMVPAVWALSLQRSTLAIVPAVIYGMVIFAVAAYALQLITNTDLNQLAQAIAARAGRKELTPAEARALFGELGRQARSRLQRVTPGLRRRGTPQPALATVAASVSSSEARQMAAETMARSSTVLRTVSEYVYGADPDATMILPSVTALGGMPGAIPLGDDEWVSVVFDDDQPDATAESDVVPAYDEANVEYDDQLRETVPIRAVRQSAARAAPRGERPQPAPAPAQRTRSRAGSRKR